MGLDIVELFIRFEEEFELKFPDEIAATLETPKMAIDYVMTTSKVKNKGWSRDFVAGKARLLNEDNRGSVSGYDEDSYFVNDMGMD